MLRQGKPIHQSHALYQPQGVNDGAAQGRRLLQR